MPDIHTPVFPEEILTEDEKCSLFYTISHTINTTARYDDRIEDVYQRSISMSRAPQGPGSSSINNSKPIQSPFLPKPSISNANQITTNKPNTAAPYTQRNINAEMTQSQTKRLKRQTKNNQIYYK